MVGDEKECGQLVEQEIRKGEIYERRKRRNRTMEKQKETIATRRCFVYLLVNEPAVTSIEP